MWDGVNSPRLPRIGSSGAFAGGAALNPPTSRARSAQIGLPTISETKCEHERCPDQRPAQDPPPPSRLEDRVREIRVQRPHLVLSPAGCRIVSRRHPVSIEGGGSMAPLRLASDPRQRVVQRARAEHHRDRPRGQPGAASAPVHGDRSLDARAADGRRYRVVGEQVDRAIGPQHQSLAVGPDDLDAEPDPAPDDRADDLDLGTAAQPSGLQAVDVEADRRPGLARLDAGQRLEQLVGRDADVDLRAPGGKGGELG